MAPSSTATSTAPGRPSGEAGLRTSSSEERTRTWDIASATSAKATPPGPTTGDVLKNRFVVHQCLTGGTAGRLLRARDRRRQVAGDADSWVALKVVTAAPGREPRALQALRREAAIAARLEHPNLPQILGLDHDGPHTFLCMAWLEGESLATILDSRGARPMTRVQAMHIVEGVCRALAHVHNLGITHADVKPGNILVTPEGNATLLDFGVALGPGAGDLPDVQGYTPEYASPEVLGGAAPTPADDLFSVACVAYRMLSGHRAFGTGNARDAAARGTRPPCPPNLSPAQWRALDKALAFPRAERQPDVATFLAQLKGLRDDSAPATAMTPDEPLPAFATAAVQSRRPAWPAAALVAGALVAAILAGVLPQWEPAQPAVSARVAPADDAVPGPALGPAPAVAATPAARASRPKAASMPSEPAAHPARRPSLLAAAVPATRKELAGPPRPEMGVPPPIAAAGPRADGAVPDTGVPAVERTVPFSSLTVRRYVEPDYPRIAEVRRLPGWVDVAFTVDTAGRTRDVRVTGAEPAGLFEDAALAAVRRWRFTAGTTGTPAAESPGPVSSQIRVRFDPQ